VARRATLVPLLGHVTRATLVKRTVVGKSAGVAVLGAVAAEPPSPPRSKTQPVWGERTKKVVAGKEFDRAGHVSKKFR
jgi:hypothetical protein